MKEIDTDAVVGVAGVAVDSVASVAVFVFLLRLGLIGNLCVCVLRVLLSALNALCVRG